MNRNASSKKCVARERLYQHVLRKWKYWIAWHNDNFSTSLSGTILQTASIRAMFLITALMREDAVVDAPALCLA